MIDDLTIGWKFASVYLHFEIDYRHPSDAQVSTRMLYIEWSILVEFLSKVIESTACRLSLWPQKTCEFSFYPANFIFVN